MATMPRFCEFYPQEGSVHTSWQRYPKDGVVGVFSYIMSTLPTRWRRGRQFCLQDGGVSGSLPTRWRRYQQDGGFTHKMPTRWRQCRVSASFAHKMAACIQYGGVTHKMVALPTRCLQDGDSVVFLRVLPQDGGVHTRWWRYPKDGGVGVFFL